MKKLFITAVLLLLLPLAAAAYMVQPFEAHYEVTWNGINAGTSIQRLQKLNDNFYRLTSTAAPALKFIPYSSWEISDFRWQGQLIPHYYEYKIEEPFKTRKGITTFDWEKEIAIDNSPQGRKTFNLNQSSQDRLTYILLLQQQLRTETLKDSYNFHVVGRSKIRNYSFKVLGYETIPTPIGDIKALKLENISGKRRTILWMDPSFSFRLVKLQQFNKGSLTGSAVISKWRLLTSN